MKAFARLVLSFFVATLFVSIVSARAFAAEDGNEMSLVIAVLEKYKKSSDVNDFRIMAECLPPPMDKANNATQTMLDAFVVFADTYERNWGDDMLPGVQLDQLRVHPLSYLSNYSYSNVTLNGNFAYANIQMYVNGELRQSVQHLSKVNGKWYVVQKKGPPEFTARDREKILALADLQETLATSTLEIAKSIESSTLSQEEAIQLIQEILADFETRRQNLDRQ